MKPMIQRGHEELNRPTSKANPQLTLRRYTSHVDMGSCAKIGLNDVRHWIPCSLERQVCPGRVVRRFIAEPVYAQTRSRRGPECSEQGGRCRRIRTVEAV